MLQYKLKRFYKDFEELRQDILGIYPNAKIEDDYFKMFVLNNDKLEKLIIHHHSDKIEVVK